MQLQLIFKMHALDPCRQGRSSSATYMLNRSTPIVVQVNVGQVLAEQIRRRARANATADYAMVSADGAFSFGSHR